MPHEEYLGMYKVNRTDAASLVKTIKDVLLMYGLTLKDCCGQCYDGASVMSGVKAGVSTLIQQVSLVLFKNHYVNSPFLLAMNCVWTSDK